jgi:hypothetical protein
MALRIVVGFLTRVGSATVRAGDAHLKRVAELCRKAEALGGTMCAFGSRSVAFDFAGDEIEEAIWLALGEGGSGEEGGGPAEDRELASLVPWRIGIAEGELLRLAETGPRSALAWGGPLVTAVALARIARPGEVLIDPDVSAVARGEIMTSGERVGKEATPGLRGLVVDPRHLLRTEGPKTVVTEVARPSLVGHHAVLDRLLSSDATMCVVRADPGYGGTRLLHEIESALAPARSLYLTTAGAEPLGALRRAFARSIAAGGPATGSLSAAEQSGLERLLAGDGVDVRLGAELIVRWIASGAIDDERPQGAVLVDDTMDVDDPSLDVVAAAAELDGSRLRIFARLDAETALPPAFQPLAAGPTVNLGPLPRSAAEQLATSAAQGSLSSDEARRWARRGRFVPLGIVEALAEGLASGELSGIEDGVPTPRTGVDVRVQLDAKDWVQRRLKFVPAAARALQRAVAVLGAEADAKWAHELAAMMGAGDSEGQEAVLARGGWLVVGADGTFALPSRTHREVVLASIPEAERASWHEAASRLVERSGGTLASAEAARHAALAGDHQRAVDLALVAAQASRQLELDAATDALLAFAGASPDDLAPHAPSPDFRLMSWIDGLQAGGERNGAAARLHAIASLARGETAEALVALREGVETAENAPPAARSRALLAYGIGLAVTGSHTEALFAALEALARAREGNEPRGARACARFLTRLAGAAGHKEAALEWQRIAAEGI